MEHFIATLAKLPHLLSSTLFATFSSAFLFVTNQWVEPVRVEVKNLTESSNKAETTVKEALSKMNQDVNKFDLDF